MRRLPRYEPAEERLEGPPPERRPSLPGHLVGVVLALPGMHETEVLEVLHSALSRRSIHAAVEAMPAVPGAPAREALEARLGAHPACVTVGALGVALFRPRLALLITGGAPSRSWSAAARALRPRFDLELSEPRPGVFEALFERPTIIACPGDG